MQAFKSQTPKARANLDPLADTTLLATLLVPQLEAYLALNTTVRLLVLEYTSNHLSTVLALRNIIGPDLIKIGGILDSLASDPSPPARVYTPPKPLSNEALAARSGVCNTPRSAYTISSSSSQNTTIIAKFPVASFSKADYVLPPTATLVEITAFLSSILTPIVQSSPWYTPEPEPVIHPPPKIVDASTITSTALYNSSSKPPTPTTTFPSTARPGSSHCAAAGQPSKLSRITGAVVDPRPSSQNNSSHNVSIQYFSAASSIYDYAPSITSIVTTNSEAERREKEDKDWENFYIADEDSEDDAYDRMVMGRAGARLMGTMGIGEKAGKALGASEMKNGNSRKALKWLGLA